MQYIILAQLRKDLSKQGFCDDLKYTQYCVTKRNNPVAWLVPPQNPKVTLDGYISTTNLKNQISYQVDLLTKEQKHRPKEIVGLGLLGIGSEHIADLVVNPDIF